MSYRTAEVRYIVMEIKMWPRHKEPAAIPCRSKRINSDFASEYAADKCIADYIQGLSHNDYDDMDTYLYPQKVFK